MSTERRVLVGIPAYNAENSITDVIRRVRQQPIHDVVVVDDGSRDRTLQAVRSIESTTVISHGQNRGYGASQKTILDHFGQWARSQNDLLVFLHADGEMRPEEIPVLLEPFSTTPGVEVVFGSRVLMQRRRSDRSPEHIDRPAWKTILDSVATRAQNWVYHADLSTYFGGFRAICARALEKIPYRSCHDKHFFDQELLAKLVVSGIFLIEVPVSNVENGSISNYSLLRNAFNIAACASRYYFSRNGHVRVR